MNWVNECRGCGEALSQTRAGLEVALLPAVAPILSPGIGINRGPHMRGCWGRGLGLYFASSLLTTGRPLRDCGRRPKHGGILRRLRTAFKRDLSRRGRACRFRLSLGEHLSFSPIPTGRGASLSYSNHLDEQRGIISNPGLQHRDIGRIKLYQHRIAS